MSDDGSTVIPRTNGYPLLDGGTGCITMSKVRRFRLVRTEDESGVSGTGIVAVGAMFPSGYCEMEWLNADNSRVETCFNGHASYPGGPDDLIEVHGHEGRTTIEWVDD